MLKTIFLSGLCGLSGAVFAQSSERLWDFESYHCVFNCNASLDELLKSELGKSLDLENPKSGFSLFDDCNGKLDLKVSGTPTESVLRELNQTVSGSKRFTKSNTGLGRSVVNSGYAVCTEENKSPRTTFWILDLSPRDMRIYYEGETILRFKKKTAAF